MGTGSVIHKDCIQEFKSWPDNHVDMILTSPPFKEEDVEGDYWEFYDVFFNEALRVTSKVLCIIHSATKLNTLISKYPPKRTLIWGKGIIAPSWRYNPILCYQKTDDYKINKYIWSDTIGVLPIKGSKKVHKYEDPVELYSILIRMFKGCETVCDPFCGSGVLKEACIRNDRNYICIDKDIQSAEMTWKRTVDGFTIYEGK